MPGWVWLLLWVVLALTMPTALAATVWGLDPYVSTLLANLFALLSLTVVRMIPLAISMVGTGLRVDTVLMMGWFGPRGLASVVFTLMVFESFHKAGQPFDLLVDTATWTVLLSVVLHGLSAVPLADSYARRLEKADPSAPELVELPELGMRRRDPLQWLRHPRQAIR